MTHMRLHTLLRRITVGTVVLAVAGSGLLVGGVASAQEVAGTLTPTPAAGSDLTIISGTTDGTCDAPGTDDVPVDGYNVFITGPGAFAADAAAGRPDGLLVVPTSDLGFSTTDPISFTLRGSVKDLAAEVGGEVLPGDYVLTFRCVNQFDAVVYQTYSATITFTGGPPATSFTVTSPAPAAL